VSSPESVILGVNSRLGVAADPSEEGQDPYSSGPANRLHRAVDLELVGKLKLTYVAITLMLGRDYHPSATMYIE
jgi:hypothetical protein